MQGKETPTQRLIKAITGERYTQGTIAKWVHESTGLKTKAGTVSNWATGKSEPDPIVLKAIHDKFQSLGHDAVGGLV